MQCNRRTLIRATEVVNLEERERKKKNITPRTERGKKCVCEWVRCTQVCKTFWSVCFLRLYLMRISRLHLLSYSTENILGYWKAIFKSRTSNIWTIVPKPFRDLWKESNTPPFFVSFQPLGQRRGRSSTSLFCQLQCKGELGLQSIKFRWECMRELPLLCLKSICHSGQGWYGT